MAETLSPDERGVGDNSTKAMSDEELIRHVDEVIAPIEDNIASEQAAIRLAKADLKGRGISMRAFAFAREARKLTDEKLAKESVSLSIACRALGVEMQGVLFQPAELPEAPAPKQPKPRGRPRKNQPAD